MDDSPASGPARGVVPGSHRAQLKLAGLDRRTGGHRVLVTGCGLDSRSGPTHHQLGGELNVLVLMWSIVVERLDLGEEKFGSPDTQRMSRLSNRGQRHGRGGRKVNVVVANQRDLIGQRNSVSDESLSKPIANKSFAAKTAVGRSPAGSATNSAAATMPEPVSRRSVEIVLR